MRLCTGCCCTSIRPSFRNEYGERDARDLRAAPPRRPAAAGAFALWLETIAEVARNAALVHVGSAAAGPALHRRACCGARRVFAVTAIAIVALGIGATTAAFSVTDFVLLRPLPFPEPDRLVRLYEKTPGYRQLELPRRTTATGSKGSTVFESTRPVSRAPPATSSGSASRSGSTAPPFPFDSFPDARASQPLLGRLFTRDRRSRRRVGTADPELPPLADAVRWLSLFDRRPTGAPRPAESFTVIGVMPRAFRFPVAEVQCNWTPSNTSVET